jgi:hypothetical protein
MIGHTDILDLDRSCHAVNVWNVGSAQKMYLGNCLVAHQQKLRMTTVFKPLATHAVRQHSLSHASGNTIGACDGMNPT